MRSPQRPARPSRVPSAPSDPVWWTALRIWAWRTRMNMYMHGCATRFLLRAMIPAGRAVSATVGQVPVGYYLLCGLLGSVSISFLFPFDDEKLHWFYTNSSMLAGSNDEDLEVRNRVTRLLHALRNLVKLTPHSPEWPQRNERPYENWGCNLQDTQSHLIDFARVCHHRSSYTSTLTSKKRKNKLSSTRLKKEKNTNAGCQLETNHN